MQQPGTPSQDQLLAQRAAKKDQKAFRALYDHYAPGVLVRLCGLLGDAYLAEDCLQQVFVEAERSLHLFRGESLFGTWLHTLTTRVAYAQFRKKHRVRMWLEELLPKHQATLEHTPPLPEALLEHKELRAMVWKALDKLSPAKRMALILCDIEGHTLEEASSQLQVPVGTISSRLCQGRKELKQRLQHALRRHNLSMGDLF